MEILFAISLLLVAVAGWFLNYKTQGKFIEPLYYLFSLTALAAMIPLFDAGGEFVFYVGAAQLSLHFVLANFLKNKPKWMPALLVAAASLIVLLLPDMTVVSGDYTLLLQNPILLVFPVFGALIIWIAQMKEQVLSKFLKIDFKSKSGISRAVMLFLVGFFLFLGQFTGSSMAIVLLSIGFSSALFYLKKSTMEWNVSLGLTAILLAQTFAATQSVEWASLLVGRVSEGLLFGVVVGLFMNTLQRARKNQWIANGISLLLAIGLPLFLIVAGTQNANFGGPDAFIGFLFGFAITAFLGINTRKNIVLLSIYTIIGLLVLPMTKNTEEEEMSTLSFSAQTGEKKINSDPFEMASENVDITGSFSFDSDLSQLTFELGPQGGRTKGAFKKFNGEISLSEDHSFQQVKVVMPIANLTTFNSYRDESLMGDTYFNVSKFPNAEFNASQAIKKGNDWLVSGEFTMMEKTNKLDVLMKYLGKTGENGEPVFIGKSQLDRTEYGMKSDPKEGNVVDFQFKIVLKK